MIYAYCTTCGKALEPNDVIYPDLKLWAEQYQVARQQGTKLSPMPPTKTVCCGVSGVLFEGNLVDYWEMPTLEPNAERVSADLGTLIRLCKQIGKSPFAIRRCRNNYFIDIKAKGLKMRIANLDKRLVNTLPLRNGL